MSNCIIKLVLDLYWVNQEVKNLEFYANYSDVAETLNFIRSELRKYNCPVMGYRKLICEQSIPITSREDIVSAIKNTYNNI